MPDKISVLARRLEGLQREIRARSTQPQLAYSSIEDGSVDVYVDETQTMVIGKQHDGTSGAATVTGPTPPTPIVPGLVAMPGALRIYWDGTFADGRMAPMDFARVLVYALPLADFVEPEPLNQAIIVGQFSSATGGEISAVLEPETEYAVYFVAWSQAGKFSEASDIAFATTLAPLRGEDGADGLPGPPGEDGQSLYTWLKYADDASGTGLADSPIGKTYIGLAYNKTTPTESTDPADYQWALIKGADGLPGPPGEDGEDGAPGASLYTWVKYADTSTGGGMSDDPTGKSYIGLAYNKTTPTESTVPADYTWSLFRGSDEPEVAPTESPEITVTGTTTAFVVEAGDVDPGTRLRYYVSTVDGFTPDASSLYVTTSAQVAVITSTVDNQPFVPGTPYFFRVIAENDIDEAPPSSQVSAALNLDNVDKVIVESLVAGFALLGSIQVGQILIDANDGIVISQPDGGKIKFPSDGSAADISAHLDAFSLTVRDRLVIRGLMNEIATNSDVALASGISTPSSPPQVSRSWPSVPFNFAPGFESTVGGLVRYDANSWLSAIVIFGSSDIRLCDNSGNGFGIAKSMPSGMYAMGGVTVIGTTAYVLVYDTNRPDNANAQPYRWFVRRYDVSAGWTFLGEWEYAEYPNSIYNPTIGRDDSGSRILIARCRPNDGKPGVKSYIPSTGVLDTTTVCDATLSSNLTSVWSGTADFGSSRIILSSPASIFAFDASGNRAATSDWVKASSGEIRGLWWDSLTSRWYHLDAAGKRWTYSALTSDVTRTVQYSWFDADAGGTGQHETNPGPTTGPTFLQVKRSYMTVSCPPPNDTGGTDDPNSVRIWIDGFRQPDLGFVGSSPILTATYDIPSTGTTSKAAAFPAAGTPAVFRSGATAGGDFTIKLRGDGAWRLGDLSGDANGRAIGGAFVPIGGIVPFYGTAAQVPTGWLLCDGTDVLENTHPLLFNHLLATFTVTASGTAPNRTVPRPDLRGRVLTGVGTARNLGDNEGAAEADRSLLHSHGAGSLSTDTFTHSQAGNTPTSGGANRLTGPTGHAHNVTGNTGRGNQGGGGDFIAHMGINWIIRAA